MCYNKGNRGGEANELKIGIDRKTAKRFALFHLIPLACAALFPLYRHLVGLLPRNMTGCILHDWLFLYCPLCGGTRAVAALLRLNFAAAFHANAYVTLLAVVVLIHYVVAWVRLLRGGTVLFRFLAWEWIAAAVLLLVYGVLRNVVMVRFGYDPLGDLGAFWNGIRKTCSY